MRIGKALRVAIAALRHQRQEYAFDAQLYRRLGKPEAGMGTAQKSFERYEELSEAIAELEVLEVLNGKAPKGKSKKAKAGKGPEAQSSLWQSP